VEALKIALVAVLFLAAYPGFAADSIVTARSSDYQADSRYGRFEIRASVSGPVDLTVEGTAVAAEVFTGSTLEQPAATYTQPIPRGFLRSFRLVSLGKAKAKLLEEPSRANGYKARIRIEGKAQLHLANIRLLWESDSRFRGTPLPVASATQDNSLTGRMKLVGRFSNDVELHLRGTEVLADGPFALQMLTLSQPFPAQSLTRLKKVGKVEIEEQPSAGNRYTATLRIRGVNPKGEDRTIEIVWTR
jgi:hypothetical protein